MMSEYIGYVVGGGLKENLSKFRARYDYCKDKNVEIILDNKEVLLQDRYRL